jgi:hypothetical protein
VGLAGFHGFLEEQPHRLRCGIVFDTAFDNRSGLLKQKGRNQQHWPERKFRFLFFLDL